MSRRKGSPKTGGSDWQPGQTGNPRAKDSGEIKQIVKDLGRLNLKRALNIFNDICNLTANELQIKMRDPETTVIELMVLRMAAEAIKTGDHMKFNTIVDRLIGKISDKIDLQMPEPTVMKLRGQDAVLVIGQMAAEDD